MEEKSSRERGFECSKDEKDMTDTRDRGSHESGLCCAARARNNDRAGSYRGWMSMKPLTNRQMTPGEENAGGTPLSRTHLKSPHRRPSGS